MATKKAKKHVHGKHTKAEHEHEHVQGLLSEMAKWDKVVRK